MQTYTCNGTDISYNSGYSLYGQGIIGQTPCYTAISKTVSVPQSVLASISSAVAATISVQTTTAVVSVVINQVFALSLPCGGDERESSGLSTGAKAGIGVGAAAGGLILITLAIWLCLIVRKRRQKKEMQARDNSAGPQAGDAPNQVYESKQYPTSPSIAYTVPPGYQGPGPIHPQSFGSYTSWQQPPIARPGHISVSSDGTRTYSTSTPNSPSAYVTEMPAYRAQMQRHEMPAD
jgi:hypothetical protein